MDMMEDTIAAMSSPDFSFGTTTLHQDNSSEIFGRDVTVENAASVSDNQVKETLIKLLPVEVI